MFVNASGPRILLVEDDVDDRYIMHQAFSELHWEEYVKMFSGGEDLFHYINSLPFESFHPALIVLDYNIPGLNGAELLARLKKDPEYSSIPVVVYSTAMKPLLAEALKVNGAHACYEKGVFPGDYLQLAIAFKNIAEGNLLVDQLH
jgi:CheY-like chemotaxis protein